MCRGPFGGGGSSSGSSSTSNNSTNVQVDTTSNVSVPVNVDTTDLADAIRALAGAQQQAAATQGELNLLGQLGAGQAQATGAVQAAKITAASSSSPGFATIVIVVATLLGLGFTAGFLKLPKGLRA